MYFDVHSMITYSTLRSYFEGGRKVVLQTLIFFLVEAPLKKIQVSKTRTTFLPPSKLLLRVQIKRLIDYALAEPNIVSQTRYKGFILIPYDNFFLVAIIQYINQFCRGEDQN